jgi:hypothetical protein
MIDVLGQRIFDKLSQSFLFKLRLWFLERLSIQLVTLLPHDAIRFGRSNTSPYQSKSKEEASNLPQITALDPFSHPKHCPTLDDLPICPQCILAVLIHEHNPTRHLR